MLLDTRKEDLKQWKRNEDHFDKNVTGRNPDKDPEVIETIEDSRIAERLKKEREEKKLL